MKLRDKNGAMLEAPPAWVYNSVSASGGAFMSITVGRVIRPATADRIFFTGMAFAVAAMVLAGFAPTYYLRNSALPALTPLYHFHGFLFTTWMALLVGQTTLVARSRTDLHRSLGVLGAVLAGLMVIIGVTVSVEALRRGAAPPGVDPRAFFSLPIADIAIFGVLVGLALAWRRKPDVHKRLMLLGTISLLTAAVARFLVFALGPQTSPLGLFIGTDIFVFAVVAYDFISRARVHWATWFGGAMVVLLKPAFVAFGFTPVWLALANSL